MTATVFQKATKYQSRLRLALAGPAGAGKTYTALKLAGAFGSRIALIDTEHGSASKYADTFGFDTLQLDTFHPARYIDAIEAANAAGYDVLVIDSLSHAWSGKGGVLEEKDRLAKTKFGGNTFTAWAEASALQTRLVEAILASSSHVICTVRSKMEYTLERDERGKSTPRKVGMAPIQRDDLPYEFDVFARLEGDHSLTIEKSRCSAVAVESIVPPRDHEALGATLRDWLSGEPAPPPVRLISPDDIHRIQTDMKVLAYNLGCTIEAVKSNCLDALGLQGPISALPAEQVAAVREWIVAAAKPDSEDV